MRNYCFLPDAPADHPCEVCRCAIRKGDKAYFETTERKVICVECGREIRRTGNSNAKRPVDTARETLRKMFGDNIFGGGY